ncbi:MAG: head protein [Betaproteobacteria bacterium]|nr:head protein [Betaproteobacteria bacterium]
MTIVSNTFTTYSAKGIREDLSNVITNIAPEETPFQSNIGRETISNTLFEWQTDTLADAAANAQLEGDDVATFDSVTATVRLTNYAQISRKTIILSNTEEVVNKAGRRSELAYQIAKRGSELKRDQEFIFLNGGYAVAGNTTTARVTASLNAFVKTNTDKQTNGVDPSYTTLPNSARTDGNVRTFTETILKNVIQKVWTAGGTPKILMTGPVNKQRVSGFSGIASSRFNIDGGAKPATLIGAVDIYVSDFGNVSTIANRFQRERDAWVIDPDYAKMTVLRPYQQVELAKTGDAEKRMLLIEYGLKVLAENAHGLAADLITS